MRQAIITALITGIFTVVAGIAMYWATQKEPALTYSVSGSPTLPGAGVLKQIYVIEVQNTGKKEVAHPFAEVKVTTGQIEESASEGSPGLEVKEERKPTSFSVSADTLNPGEHLKLSLLLSSQVGEIKPVVVVRAPGVNASLLSPSTQKSPKRELPILLIAALGAAASVLLSATPLVRRLFKSATIIPVLPGSPLKQNEIVAYICAQAGLDEEAETFRFAQSELSYRGAADYLMLRALKADQSTRKRYVTALKAMLLLDRINPRSIESIKRSIRVLLGPSYNEAALSSIVKKAVDEGADPVGLRDKIDKLVSAELR